MKKQKNRLMNMILVAVMLLCFTAAGIMAYFFFGELNTRNEAGESTDTVRDIALQQGTPVPVVTETPTVTEAPEEADPVDDADLEYYLALTQSGDYALPTVPPQDPRDYSANKPVTTDKNTTEEISVPSETSPVVSDNTLSPEIIPTPTVVPTPTPVTTPLVGHALEAQVQLSVDFAVLSAVNEDIRAWLYQEGTEINYPVVQAQDNSYYLTHLFDKKENKAGSIFLDCGNSYCFSDSVTYLYGHNRNDATMFASIAQYRLQEYYDLHPDMTLITPYEDYRLQIFACVRRSIVNSDGWRVKMLYNKADFDALVDGVLEESLIHTDVLPVWGDQLIALCTCTNEVHEERYILYARMRPLIYVSNQNVNMSKAELDGIDNSGYSRAVTLPGFGKYQYYAQNDPIWSGMRFEAKGITKSRRMGSSGSAPAAMAMVVSNLVPQDRFWWLSYYSGLDTGFIFCSHSVNQYFCDHSHAQYRLETDEEFLRYMPVAVASFATGNNLEKLKSRDAATGTKPTFMGQIANIYGLNMRLTKNMSETLNCVRGNGMAIVGTGSGPYTGRGQYIVIAKADDQYLYILDPYMTTSYSETDRRHVLEVLEPGVLRAKISDWDQLGFYRIYLFGQ